MDDSLMATRPAPIAADARHRFVPRNVPAARAPSRFQMMLIALLALTQFNCGCQTSLKQWVRNGFKVGPNYCGIATATAADWLETEDSRFDRKMLEDCCWWSVFQDQQLNHLIQLAGQQNLDLRTAGMRIQEAGAQRNVAVGNLFPQSQTALIGYAHAQLPGHLLGLPIPHTVSVWPAGFNASWEADFWGRFRRSIEAADGDYQASIEDYYDSALALLSSVATDYLQLRTFEQRIVYARNNVRIQKAALELAELRFDKGITNELDVVQARTNLAQTEASIPPLIAGRRQASNRLCILMGMPVSDLAEHLGSGPIPTAPAEIASGIPADLLRRRPDVRRAEQRVAAQTARIGVAEADFYPRLALTGFLGYAGTDLEHLFTPSSFLAFIFPSLQWNVLNYGRICNNVRVQEARMEQSALQYQQAVLTAGREVQDALVAFVQSREQMAKLEESVNAATRGVELVLTQYEAGTTDFNRVFNAQATLVTQQDQLALVRGNVAINLVNVYKALGGGWECIDQSPGIAAVISTGEIVPPTPSEAAPMGTGTTAGSK